MISPSVWRRRGGRQCWPRWRACLEETRSSGEKKYFWRKKTFFLPAPPQEWRPGRKRLSLRQRGEWGSMQRPRPTNNSPRRRPSLSESYFSGSVLEEKLGAAVVQGWQEGENELTLSQHGGVLDKVNWELVVNVDKEVGRQVDKEVGTWRRGVPGWQGGRQLMQGAIQPPAKVPLQRRKDKDQNHLLLNLDLSLEFMRNVSSTFIPQRHR